MPPSPLADRTLRTFLEQLASAEPTPGGGSAAALVGATAAALARMVAAYTLGRPKFAAVEARVQRLADQLARAQEALLELSDEDAAAYDVLSAALKLPQSDSSRAARIAKAAVLAASIPLETATFAARVHSDTVVLGQIGNPRLRSDAEAAAHFARAAGLAALANVRANLELVEEGERARFLTGIEAAESALHVK
ncbi:MAG: cyclodeaminase/cyclohydrolase family protein [Phycisphaerales bacterium]|nr:cyclodeaminase/cyclohydrolase family protein [Phycisphaerales bacterium]